MVLFLSQLTWYLFYRFRGMIHVCCIFLIDQNYFYAEENNSTKASHFQYHFAIFFAFSENSTKISRRKGIEKQPTLNRKIWRGLSSVEALYQKKSIQLNNRNVGPLSISYLFWLGCRATYSIRRKPVQVDVGGMKTKKLRKVNSQLYAI